MNPSESFYIEDTRRWLERAVIGLNLCPFAKAVHAKQQIHYALSQARSLNELCEELGAQLRELVKLTADVRETTLLIVPTVLQDFLDFNEFLAEANEVLIGLDLEGVIQIASFHPDYQFAGTRTDDITNFTNRSPYPILHLIREASIDRAVEAFPDPQAIFQTNMQTLENLGPAGWAALNVGATPVPESRHEK